MTSVLDSISALPPPTDPQFWKARVEFARAAVQELRVIQYVSLVEYQLQIQYA